MVTKVHVRSERGAFAPRPQPADGPLLVPGRNCWRIEHAERAAFLVDGEEYFGAVRSALAKARHSIMVLGWDIDSRMRLVPGGANDGLPETLAEFLNAIVEHRHELRGYLLSWDFAMLYAMEREWLPIYKLDWRTHRRLSFRLDDHHPTGASHHQKVVVVDDAVAFVSGFDLTRCRWDTSEHAANDPCRVDHTGDKYAPFHDVGIVVDGDCARALGDLACERWYRATGKQPRRRTKPLASDPWPDGVEPVARSVNVAISRTEPAFDGFPAVGEIRRLHLDAIGAAKHSIFAENQYFTSRIITEAFTRRLRAPDAPEIAVLSPYMQSGWLEISTMGVLRSRIHAQLRAADRQCRYRLYCPTLPWLDTKEACLNVHSKVLIVDDSLVSVGSANLSDRSMSLDTECNLTIEAGGREDLRSMIRDFRHRLLAEHVGATREEVAEAIAREGSMHRAIDSLNREGRRGLEIAEPKSDPTLDALVPDRHVFDPEQPLDPDVIVADLVPQEKARTGARIRLIGLAVAIVLLASMALAWRYTPLREWLAVDRLVDAGLALREQPWAPLAAMAAFVVGSLIAFPLLALIAITAMVFGPWLGPLYALLGAVTAAAVTFGIGRVLGRETVRRLAGDRLNNLSRRLAKRGLLTVAFVRMLPIAPFSVVNVVAGASHIRWTDFLLGTLIGLLPGILAMTFFVDRIIAAIRDPGAATFALLFVAAAVIVTLAVVLRRKLRGPNGRSWQPPRPAHGS